MEALQKLEQVVADGKADPVYNVVVDLHNGLRDQVKMFGMVFSKGEGLEPNVSHGTDDVSKHAVASRFVNALLRAGGIFYDDANGHSFVLQQRICGGVFQDSRKDSGGQSQKNPEVTTR